MDEAHHEHHYHEHQPKKENIIAASIIVGTILISASIFYNAKLILQKIDEGGQIQAQSASSQPAALPAPSQQPTVAIQEREDAAVLGSARAKVSLVEFSDFQCPFCQRFFKETLSAIKSKYIDTGQVKLIYRHFPLSGHQNAQKAAEASECASRQGKFWQYHDMLFNKGQPNGSGLNVDELKQYARDLGLDSPKFNRCLDNGEAAAAVAQDMKDAGSAGVNGTPNVFVDGKLVAVYDSSRGQWQGGALPLAKFEEYIETALK